MFTALTACYARDELNTPHSSCWIDTHISLHKCIVPALKDPI